MEDLLIVSPYGLHIKLIVQYTKKPLLSSKTTCFMKFLQQPEKPKPYTLNSLKPKLQTTP